MAGVPEDMIYQGAASVDSSLSGAARGASAPLSGPKRGGSVKVGKNAVRNRLDKRIYWWEINVDDKYTHISEGLGFEHTGMKINYEFFMIAYKSGGASPVGTYYGDAILSTTAKASETPSAMAAIGAPYNYTYKEYDCSIPFAVIKPHSLTRNYRIDKKGKLVGGLFDIINADGYEHVMPPIVRKPGGPAPLAFPRPRFNTVWCNRKEENGIWFWRWEAGRQIHFSDFIRNDTGERVTSTCSDPHSFDDPLNVYIQILESFEVRVSLFELDRELRFSGRLSTNLSTRELLEGSNPGGGEGWDYTDLGDEDY
jgi:hypothetical protein